MKNKSKRIFFVAVVLRALLLIMPVSALAAAEEEQEIGVPQAMSAPVKGCFGAVLSPDGDNFYTVHEGILTQYKINPFKKIDSVVLEQEPFKEKWCRVLITNDRSKLIIVYYDRMFLLDARTGQILHKLGRQGGRLATINGNDLVILDKNGGEEYGEQFLTIWDANTLKLKREIRNLERFGFIPFPNEGTRMAKILDRIYLDTYNRTVVLSSKTYTPELTLSFRPGEGSARRMSKDFQKLYVPNILELKVTDHLSGKQTNYDDVKGGSVFVFDQETREFNIENLNNISREEYARLLLAGSQLLSLTKEYAMVGGASIDEARSTLLNLNSGKTYGFYQYESGEAMAIMVSNKYFQLTPGARKYLMMKNSAGKIVPISDATFAKYHRTENWP